MYRLIKRYIVTVIIVFCLFWLCIDLMWIQWRKEDIKYVKPKNNFHKKLPAEKNSEKIKFVERPTTKYVETQKIKKDVRKLNFIKTKQRVETTRSMITSDNLVSIDYFKQFYKYSLNPQPGSAGMEGAAVKNSVDEKVQEDLGFKNYSFNELSSSKISLERSVPDNREDA